MHHGVALGQALGALELGIQLLKAGHLLLDSASFRFGLLIDWGKKHVNFEVTSTYFF